MAEYDTKFYVTKWALQRGIVVLMGTTPKKEGSQSTFHSWVDVPGPYPPNSHVTVGRDAFLTLEEAQQDAEKRFRAHKKKLRAHLRQAKRHLKALESGGLQVHEHPPTPQAFKACKPFSE